MGKINRQFPVVGMMCAVCAGTVEKTAAEVPGVLKSEVNFANSSLTVEWDPAKTSPAAIADAIRSAGYEMIVEHSEQKEIEEKQKDELFKALVASGKTIDEVMRFIKATGEDKIE